MINFETLPKSHVYKWDQLAQSFRVYAKGDPLPEFVKEGFVANMQSLGFVFNTFEDLEASYIDHMR